MHSRSPAISPLPSSPFLRRPNGQLQQSPLSRSSSGARNKVNMGTMRFRKRRGLGFCLGLVVLFFLVECFVLRNTELNAGTEDQARSSRFLRRTPPPIVLYERLLALAAHALAENEFKPEPNELWKEPIEDASIWKPCADQRAHDHKPPPLPNRSTGYIMVSANGGLNQQRVAICNAIAVARLLNATLVLPMLLTSSVWEDESQFGDIYQEDHFIDYLKHDVHIVKELPVELRSLDLEAIGSFISDLELMKESKPSFYIERILPILLRNRVVHFFGFGNRLSFDPIPFDIQRLRCRCNFHALKFVPKIQYMGDLLVERMRTGGESHHYRVNSSSARTMMKFVGLHLRFEIDMVAHSMCEFGGGESERQELEAYREKHFPLLAKFSRQQKFLPAKKLRESGQCPLTPEEAVLMLAALGFKRGTRIFLAGAHIYGGQARMSALVSLYPNLLTKEDLLTQTEMETFGNHSSQLAALDTIVCIAADVFAMTDSGSQLASLVTGFRIYFGGGKAPTIRPNKRRLESIFLRNRTIEWKEFQDSIWKSVKESKRIQIRPVARSIYRHPRCLECMCKDD